MKLLKVRVLLVEQHSVSSGEIRIQGLVDRGTLKEKTVYLSPGGKWRAERLTLYHTPRAEPESPRASMGTQNPCQNSVEGGGTEERSRTGHQLWKRGVGERLWRRSRYWVT